MSAEQVGLTAFWVPSTHVTDYTVKNALVDSRVVHKTARPYKRIVGLETALGDELWAPQDFTGDPESEFSELEARTNALPLPFDGQLSDRLIDFFSSKIASDSRPRVGSPADYNCHSFAFDMQGGFEGADHKMVHKLSDGVVAYGATTEQRLKVGEHGVVGFLGGGEDPRACHSVIGLGEDNPECIQAMWIHGHIGISSYDDVMKFYRKFTGGWLRSLRGVTKLGMYTMQAADQTTDQTANLATPQVASQLN